MSMSFLGFSQTKIGAELGVGISNRTNIDEFLERTEGILSIQSEIGTNLALVTQLDLAERWFLKTGAVYQSFSYTEKVDAELLAFPKELEPYYCFLPSEEQVGLTSIKYRYNFIEIPFVVNYQFAQSCEECGWKWFAGVGPTVSWLLQKKVKTPLIKDGNYIDVDCVPPEGLLLGAQAVIGGEYKFSGQQLLNFSLVYDQQIQPIYRDENAYSLYSIGVRVAYYFVFNAIK